jgi:hypothetical protein
LRQSAAYIQETESVIVYLVFVAWMWSGIKKRIAQKKPTWDHLPKIMKTDGTPSA